MNHTTRGPLLIAACESGMPFAQKVFSHLKAKAKTEEARDMIHFIKSHEPHFANTEVKTVIDESVRGADVYIFQDVENSITGYSVDENLRSLLTMIDAAKRSSAGHVSAVIPVFPYARQDKPKGREGITASRVAQSLEQTGASEVITLDVHNEAIIGFFRQAVLDNLHASKNIIEYVKSNIVKNNTDRRHLVISSADVNGAKRAEDYAETLRKRFVICYKTRDPSKPNSVKEEKLLGKVRDCDVLVVDDMIDTAGTMGKVCRVLKAKRARKIYLACSLPLFNGDAIGILNKLHEDGLLEAVIGTDAVYHGDDFEKQHTWFKTASVVRYFTKVINNLNKNMSISQLLE